VGGRFGKGGEDLNSPQVHISSMNRKILKYTVIEFNKCNKGDHMPKQKETIVRGITFCCFSKFIDQM